MFDHKEVSHLIGRVKYKHYLRLLWLIWVFKHAHTHMHTLRMCIRELSTSKLELLNAAGDAGGLTALFCSVVCKCSLINQALSQSFSWSWLFVSLMVLSLADWWNRSIFHQMFPHWYISIQQEKITNKCDFFDNVHNLSHYSPAGLWSLHLRLSLSQQLNLHITVLFQALHSKTAYFSKYHAFDIYIVRLCLRLVCSCVKLSVCLKLAFQQWLEHGHGYSAGSYKTC